jgi:hypothetical protein
MFDQVELGSEFFERLRAVDESIVRAVAAGACRFCGGRLHRGDYPRKPRGGALGVAVEGHDRRFSLCCSRDGCRRRATPPSVRFLGRRVYAGAVVIVASVIALAALSVAAMRRATGVPPRTLRRWRRWWCGPFTTTPVFVAISGRHVPAIDRSSLPRAILERLRDEPGARVERLLAWLAPITTALPDGSRFMRGIV